MPALSAITAFAVIAGARSDPSWNCDWPEPASKRFSERPIRPKNVPFLTVGVYPQGLSQRLLETHSALPFTGSHEPASHEPFWRYTPSEDTAGDTQSLVPPAGVVQRMAPVASSSADRPP